MYSTRFSRLTNPDVMRMFTLLRERKGITKIPNKTVEYYTGDDAAVSKKAYFTVPQKPTSMNQL